MPTPTFLLITCEHGGNRIPSRYRDLFQGHDDQLNSHRAYDPGALQLAEEMAATQAAPLIASTISRLLIDLNRSLGHPRIYSEMTRSLAPSIREEIMRRYYLPYRTKVETAVTQVVATGTRVVHISCHSFTPEFDGKLRDADIGLLYDPGRNIESALCRDWKAALETRAPDFRTRMNYPYKGISDGLPTYLRRHLSADSYVGIELEINQRQVRSSQWQRLREAVIGTLDELMKEL